MRPFARHAAFLCLLEFTYPAAAAGVEVPNPLGDAQKPLPTQSRPRQSGRPEPVPSQAGQGAVFPKALDPRYAGESPGRARMHTCLDQYRANAGAGNGGLRWIEKGGGYCSQCNKRLKG